MPGRLQLSPRDIDAASPRAPPQVSGSEFGAGGSCTPGPTGTSCWPSSPSQMAACRLLGLADAPGLTSLGDPTIGASAGAYALSASLAGFRLDARAGGAAMNSLAGAPSASGASDVRAGVPGGLERVRDREDKEAQLLLQLLAALVPLSADERCPPRNPGKVKNPEGRSAAPLAPLLAAQLLAGASGRARMARETRSCAVALLHCCAAQLQPAAAILPPADPPQDRVACLQNLAAASGAQVLAQADALWLASARAGLGLREGSGSCASLERRHVLVAAAARSLEAALDGCRGWEDLEVRALRHH